MDVCRSSLELNHSLWDRHVRTPNGSVLRCTRIALLVDVKVKSLCEERVEEEDYITEVGYDLQGIPHKVLGDGD